jgi:SAM-dependent methyltransferase
MAEKHYQEQVAFSRSYLIPFFQQHIADFAQKRVLEIGCAEAGFLDVLFNMGMVVTGVELSADRVRLAQSKNAQLDVRVGDITDRALPAQLGGSYDLIVIREVIEHVQDREAAFSVLTELLADDGWLYVTFPPRFSPFAGHQQVGRSLLRRVPYVHFMPAFLLKALGRLCGEHEYIIRDVLHNFRIGLSIRHFDRYRRQHGYTYSVRDLFLIRPIYQHRFGCKPVRLADWPVLREFLATGCECLLRKRGGNTRPAAGQS